MNALLWSHGEERRQQRSPRHSPASPTAKANATA